jgi:hypothetical protein
MYLGHDISGQGVVREVSGAGCQLLGTTPVRAGETLSVRLALPNGPQPVVIKHATVRWVKGFEFGLAFEDLDKQARTPLQAMLHEMLTTRRYSGVTKPQRTALSA